MSSCHLLPPLVLSYTALTVQFDSLAFEGLVWLWSFAFWLGAAAHALASAPAACPFHLDYFHCQTLSHLIQRLEHPELLLACSKAIVALQVRVLLTKRLPSIASNTHLRPTCVSRARVGVSTATAGMSKRAYCRSAVEHMSYTGTKRHVLRCAIHHCCLDRSNTTTTTHSCAYGSVRMSLFTRGCVINCCSHSPTAAMAMLQIPPTARKASTEVVCDQSITSGNSSRSSSTCYHQQRR